MQRLRVTAAILAALVLSGLTATAAPARASVDHWVYEQGWVWQTQDHTYCLRNRTSVTADSPSADKTTTDANAYEDFWGVLQCDTGQAHWSRPAGNLAAITFLYIWAPKPGWTVCMHLPWGYNGETTHEFIQAHTWKDANIMSCYKALGIYRPRGWVASWGGTFVKDYGGTWRPSVSGQGYLWSGKHEYNRG